MVKEILGLVLIFLLGLNGNAQNTAIPDANFEMRLGTLGLQPGPIDGFIPTANIDTVTSLKVWNENIADLTGIQDFAALELLWCNDNQLTSLNVTQNINLTELRCNNNQLSSLNVTQNTALIKLHCDQNQITSLNVSQNTGLIDLFCQDNSLTNLTGIPNLPSLYNLIAVNNMLPNIDFSQNINLFWLMLVNNQMTNLNLSNNINLGGLNCMNNQLTCLNVKSGNNTALTTFLATGNSNLTCVEVDNVAFSTTNWTSIDAGTTFSTNCSNACSTVGLNENNQFDNFNIYPNPTKDVLTIYNENNEGIIISIKDVTGKELIAEKSTNPLTSINLKNYKAGVYFITLSDKNSSITKKILKQ
jgi:hypothetical protein